MRHSYFTMFVAIRYRKQLVPELPSFANGVVDVGELHDTSIGGVVQILQAIKKNFVKKCWEMLAEIGKKDGIQKTNAYAATRCVDFNAYVASAPGCQDAVPQRQPELSSQGGRGARGPCAAEG